MPTIKLGVRDFPYKTGPARTTGEVAEILESRYHVLENFAAHNQQRIANYVAQSLAGALDTGRSVPIEAFDKATKGVVRHFRYSLSIGTMERWGIPGVPTQAALRGVRHTLPHPYAKANPRRPSFIDTGAYKDAFTAWVEP